MKKPIAFAFAAILLLAFVSGCAQQPSPGDTGGSQAAPAATEIDSDIAALDELDLDMDMSELDSLDQEFADLESMFS